MNKLAYLQGYMEKRAAKIDKLLRQIPLDDMAANQPQMMRYLLKNTVGERFGGDLSWLDKTLTDRPDKAGEIISRIRDVRKRETFADDINYYINRNQEAQGIHEQYSNQIFGDGVYGAKNRFIRDMKRIREAPPKPPSLKLDDILESQKKPLPKTKKVIKSTSPRVVGRKRNPLIDRVLEKMRELNI